MAKPDFEPHHSYDQAPLAHLIPNFVPVSGMDLPERNRTLTSPSTEFEVHIIEGVPGVSRMIDQHYPKFAGVFPDALALKLCGTQENKHFINVGEVGQETIRKETAVALRDKEVPIVLGLGWVERDTGGRMTLFAQPASGREAAMVMAKYDVKTDFATVVDAPLPAGERREIMEQAVIRMRALKVPMAAEDAQSFDAVIDTRALIDETLDRAFRWREEQWGIPPTQTAVEAHEAFNEAFASWIDASESKQFLHDEQARGAFGDQHGDPRLFDNASVLRRLNGEVVTVIRDPVRLFLLGKQRWSQFHLCHDDLQLGCLLARPLTDAKHHDLFWYGFEAHERLAGAPIVGDHRRERLFGIGLAYGALVEIVVRGYGNDAGPGPFIDDYWRVIDGLAESDFLGWKEAA